MLAAMTKRMGPQHSGQAHPTEAPEVHAARRLSGVPVALLDVALIDGPTSAAAGDVSLSTWHDGVRRTEQGQLSADEVPYPLPVIRGPRCTRWRLVDVRDYWRRRAEQGNPQAADKLMRQAAKASRAARAKRMSGEA